MNSRHGFFSHVIACVFLSVLSTIALGQSSTDTFERSGPSLGTAWNANSDLVIASASNLHNQAAPTSNSWNYLAVYKSLVDPTDVSVVLANAGDGCESADADRFGIIIVDKEDNATANGYWANYYNSTSNKTIRIYKIVNGAVVTNVTPSGLPAPTQTLSPGGTFKIKFNKTTYNFTFYVDGVQVGSAEPTDKSVAFTTVYSGVSMYAKAGGTVTYNDIESFTAEYVAPSSDTDPPATISLSTGTTTSSSVVLNWTSPTDNGASGKAASYDIRYLAGTTQITASNWASATQVSSEPTPKTAGQSESFTVSGLNASTQYYFAIKSTDDASNTSAISNSPTATTQSSGGGGTWSGNADSYGFDSAANWAYSSGQVIQTGELALNASATNGWSYLATCTKAGGSNGAEMKFSTTNSQLVSGAVPAGLAVMLDSPTSTANGYFIYKKTSIYVYRIVAGLTGGSDKLVGTFTGPRPNPNPGESIKAEIIDNGNGTKTIQFYVNGTKDGSAFTINDASNLGSTYVGVIQWGSASYSNHNNVDSFIRYFQGGGDPYKIEKESGDSQTGPILTTLPDSIKVKVTTETGTPSPDVVVNFAITQGKASLSVDAFAFDGYVWKEAESGTLTSPVVSHDTTTASGGKFVYAPYIQGEPGNYGVGNAAIPFYLPEQRSYAVWLRYLSPNGNSNSCSLKVDSGKPVYINSSSSYFGAWDWVKAITSVTLAKGFHTVTIIKREPGMLWDKILVIDKNIAYTPSGTGGSGPTFPNVTNSDGIASTAVTFGNDADTTVIVQASAYQTDGATPLVDSPVSFTLDPTPGPVNKLEKDITTDNQPYTPGGQVVLRARVLDQYNNRISGVTVGWQISTGVGGSLSASSSTTNTNGEAPITFTAGSDTLYKIRATTSQLPGQYVEFTTHVGKKAKSMSYVSGNGQTGTVGQLLGNKLVVKVIAEDNSNYSGFPVVFEVKQGNGKINGINPAQIFTNTDGLAEASWTLGPTPGLQKVQASATVPTGSPIDFTATAQIGAADTLVKVTGDNQTGPIGLPLKNPFVAKVTDAYGNGIPNWLVRFSIMQGQDAYIDFSGNQTKDVLTDSTGKAQVTLVMGSISGEINMVSATAVGLDKPSVVFQATATPGIASVLLYYSGNNQDTVVTYPLAQPLVVKVTGPYGNVISGHSVKFSAKVGGGYFSGLQDKTVTSDANGLASAVFTLGTLAGDSAQVVEVTAFRTDIPSEQLQGSPVIIKATGKPKPASKLVKYGASDNQQKPAGTALDAIKAKVTDIHDNAISGHTVHFAVQGNGGSLQDPQGGGAVKEADALTGADGYASIIWVMPDTTGQWELLATSNNAQGQPLTGSPASYKATSVSGSAHTMTRITADPLQGTVGKLLSENIKIRISDQYDNPVTGYSVLFTVAQPQGSGAKVNNLQYVTIQTAADGTAGVAWLLSTVSGFENNVVNATAGVTVNPTIIFKASGLPDVAKTLVPDATTNNQIGKVGTVLPKPIKARVVDQYSNGIPNHNVVFRVKSVNGNAGTIDGLAEKTIAAGSDGWASANWTLGPQPGSLNNNLEVSARLNETNLIGSPTTFVASATIADPDSLKKIAGDNKTGRVLNWMTDELKVKVTDPFNNPIAGHSVTFTVISRAEAGGGWLDTDVDTVQTKTTDSNGITSVRFKCGKTAGNRNNQIQARAQVNSQDLKGSPAIFYISATSSPATNMEIAGGNGQSGTVGQFLTLQLQVRARDVNTNPVTNHPIRFRILNAEPGALGNSAAIDTAINTGTDGVAGIRWRLGTKAGQSQIVEATSSSGIEPLVGSGARFTATADADVTNKDRSTVEAFPPVVNADGQAKSTIVVTLKDKFDNLVVNQAVFINASGSNNSIAQPSMPTDANGQATGSISSTKAEVKYVTARAVNHMVDIADTAEVRFIPLAAYKIDYASIKNGNYQTRNIGTVLAESLKVVVQDVNQNPIANHAVTFSVTQGGGELLDSQPAYTDANGIAWSRYRLGTKEGANLVEAKATGSNGSALVNSPVRFTETGVKNPPSTNVPASGEGQHAAPGIKLPNPLVVQVRDNNGWPVWGEPVRFSVQFNNGAIATTNPINTDLNGQASVQVLVGTEKGLNVFTASLPNYPSIGAVTFNAYTDVGSAASLVYLDGSNQYGTVNQTLLNALKVSTEDSYGNAVPGVNVTFRVVEEAGVPGIGTLTGGVKILNVTSDANGVASVTYTLGKVAGKNKIQASAPNLQPERIVFEVYGDADYAYSMEKYSGDNQKMQMGKQLLAPIAVMVKDQYGNPARNGIVTFRETQGGGYIIEDQPVLSNTGGIASSHWVIGAKPNVYNSAIAIASLPGGAFQPTFAATGEDNNYPEFSLPGEKVVNETETVSFIVNASDADGEPLYYSYDASRWPDGATFDATGTREFRWTPTYEQGGKDYYPVFIVTDARNGQDIDSVKITVVNVNRSPVITSRQPSTADFKIEWGQAQVFHVTASDPDNDPLFYRWKVDGMVQPEATSSSYTLDTNYFRNGQVVSVAAEVYDMDGAIAPAYWGMIVPVELKSFAGTIVPYEGVVIQWETASQAGNVGFNILRSLSENGEYKKINEKLIPTDESGKYKFADKSVQSGRKYYYKLEDVSNSGIKTQHGPVLAEVAAPKEFDLSQNYPNPFNPTTTIRFQLPKAITVRLEIYNTLGQVIRTMVDEVKEAGYHTVLWDGRSELGIPASSGVYYYRIHAGDFVMTKKMALLK